MTSVGFLLFGNDPTFHYSDDQGSLSSDDDERMSAEDSDDDEDEEEVKIPSNKKEVRDVPSEEVRINR